MKHITYTYTEHIPQQMLQLAHSHNTTHTGQGIQHSKAHTAANSNVPTYIPTHLWYERCDLLVAPADQCFVCLQTGLPQLVLPVIACVVHHHGNNLMQIAAESWARLAGNGSKCLDEGARIGEGEGIRPTGHTLVQAIQEMRDDVVEESYTAAGGEIA